MRLALILVAVLLPACGGQGSYELRWTLGCATAGSTASCQIRSALDCSRVGLDALEVLVRRDPTETPTRTQLACFAPGEGPVGRGPGLDEGKVSLEVYGLTPGAQRLVGPIIVDATIPSSGFVQVAIDLPVPPACGDGVDNDGDGLVDLHDPDCKDAAGTSEAP